MIFCKIFSVAPLTFFFQDFNMFCFGGFASEWEQKGTMKTEMIRFIFPVIFFVTLQETNISPPKGTFEGDFPLNGGLF